MHIIRCRLSVTRVLLCRWKLYILLQYVQRPRWLWRQQWWDDLWWVGCTAWQNFPKAVQWEILFKDIMTPSPDTPQMTTNTEGWLDGIWYIHNYSYLLLEEFLFHVGPYFMMRTVTGSYRHFLSFMLHHSQLLKQQQAQLWFQCRYNHSCWLPLSQQSSFHISSHRVIIRINR